ncbi:hypothetical protein TIFTF001_024518 [Ficus carica]|uniref:Uncharacterized protein n=1 Tax=Ficus carica TaxID=3494 RepID=A0AA88AY34_FICCA|nr:hypothetical protein TIFTF001_024518 [Ficus carica]
MSGLGQARHRERHGGGSGSVGCFAGPVAVAKHEGGRRVWVVSRVGSGGARRGRERKEGLVVMGWGG